MSVHVYVASGLTESGDQIPPAVFFSNPTQVALLRHYKALWPEEIEAFGAHQFLNSLQVRKAPLCSHV